MSQRTVTDVRDTAEYANFFKVITKLLGMGSFNNTEKLCISIPKGLYFLSPRPNNGYEHILEGKEIIIRATSRTKMSKKLGYIRIILSEEQSNLNKIQKVLKSQSLLTIPQNEKVLYMNYRIAREILIDLISDLWPYSLGLITR